jgi:flavin-dependent dehydrogenase
VRENLGLATGDWRLETRDFHIAVVGGGPAGATTALVLARMGARIVLMDRSDPRPLLGETLPPNANPILQELGLWDRFLIDGYQPAHGNHSIWGSPNLDHYDFIRSPYGSGWHLDRPQFDQMLKDAFIEAGGVLLDRTRLLSCHRNANGTWLLTCAPCSQPVGGPEAIRADFVVDATGRSHKIARSQGIPSRTHDHLIAIIGVARPSMAATHATSAEPTGANPNVGGDREPALHSSHANVGDSFTTVEAVENGWWYSNPLPDGRLALGYMTDPDLARQENAFGISGWRRLLSRTTLMKQIGTAGGEETGLQSSGYQLESTLRVVPADSSCLETFRGDGWLAVGDAAATHDPLSSQGILSGIIQGMWAANAIAKGSSGLSEYQEKMHHAYARYLAEWMSYYALEWRWPASSFWRRRHLLLENLFAA